MLVFSVTARLKKLEKTKAKGIYDPPFIAEFDQLVISGQNTVLEKVRPHKTYVVWNRR